MGLLIECASCRYRNSTKAKKCKGKGCEVLLARQAKRVYWIDYLVNGRRKRERIGPSKQVAEARLHEVRCQIMQGQYLEKPASLTLDALIDWYLNLSHTKQLKSYVDIQQKCRNLLNRLDPKLLVHKLTPSIIERYISERLAKPGREKGSLTRPATVNRDLMCLKAMLNMAVRMKKLSEHPLKNWRLLDENNVREVTFGEDDLEKVLAACPAWMEPIVMMAYYEPMRQMEIILLTWDEVDLKTGFIRLGADRNKNKTPRNIPLHPKVAERLRSLPRGLHTNRVFLRDGQPVNDVYAPYKKLMRSLGYGSMTFHDLRHCAVNNLRLAGNDLLLIRAASGHKSNLSFERYNLVSEDELKRLKWKSSEDDKEKM